MAYPILAPRDTWYTQGNSGILRSAITEIYIKDSYTPTSPVTAQWDGSAAKDGSITIYVEGTRLTISGNGSGRIALSPDASYTFSSPKRPPENFAKCTVITGLEILDTSACTTISHFFAHMTCLQTVDVSNMNVSNSTDISYVFGTVASKMGPMKLTNIKGLDSWNTGKAVSIAAFMQGCPNISAESFAPIEDWDVSSLETAQNAFTGVHLAKIDLSRWNTIKLKTVSHMLCDNASLTDVKLPRLSACENFGALFNDDNNLEVVDVRNVDFSNALALAQMWERCTKLKQIIGLETMNVGKAGSAKTAPDDDQTAFSELFSGCESIETLDLFRWDMTHAFDVYGRSMRNMFLGMKRLRKISVPPTYHYDWYEQYPQYAPLFPTPDPAYIPGADGHWYDLSGKSYTPVEALNASPNTYFASLELARKEPAILENGFMIDIGEGIRNRSGSPVRHRPSEMKAAIEAIPGSSKPEQEKSITIQKNGSYNVIPDSGNTMSKVIVTAQVPGQKPETAGSEIITSNGVHSFSPPAGGVFSNFTADVQIAQPATQEKTVEITTNGTTPVTPDLGKLLSKVIVKTNVSTGGGSVGGGNISSGRILLDSDLVISISSPLVVNHNLGVIPNVFVLFSEYEFRKGEPKHVFFSIVANDTDSGCSIKASYFSGQYPELYLYNGSNGKLSAQSHPNGKSFLDVFGATETQIKIGAYKDVSAAIQGSTKYIWIAAKI